MIIWRYGKLSDLCDYTDLDQHISQSSLKQDAPRAPQALQEALEKLIRELKKHEDKNSK
jgi:hypothetical protein